MRDKILIYDIRTGTQCGSMKMSSKRRRCSCAIVDNVLYVGGGYDEVHRANTVDRFPLGGNCSHHRVAATPTYKCSLISLCGQLVMLGGSVDKYFKSPGSNVVSVLSPSLNTWLPLPTMNQQRYLHGTCIVGDDAVMVVGGCAGSFVSLASVEVLKC